MIFLLVAAVAIFLVNRTGAPSNPGISPVPTPPVPRAVAGSSDPPVIKQAVGGSLSQALGNQNRSPKYYATGNPGTSGMSTVPSSTINYMVPKWSSPPIARTVSNPFHGQVTQNNPPAPVKSIEMTAVGAKPVSSALVNPRQALRPVIKPEWPGAFWTRRDTRR